MRLYTSQDLCNWTDRGLIIPPQPDDLSSPLHPTYCMDRPHILYCPKEAVPPPEKEQRHRENTAASRYVWLPIEWQGEKPVIRWRKSWKPGELK